jgi:hypothetical protein
MQQELWVYSASQQPTGLAISSFLQFYEFLIDHLKSLGIQVHNESRLGKYRTAVEERFVYSFTHSSILDERIFDLSYAYTELLQLAVIIYYGQLKATDTEYKDKANKLICDAANPHAVKKDVTPGRDTQFELFVSACWTPLSSKCTISPPPHPDILLLLKDYIFGIEAKRIKSTKSIDKRFSKAKKQLAKVKNGGIIAMDLSIVLEQERSVYEASSMQGAISDLERRLKEFMFSKLELARKKGQSKKAFGWFGYANAFYMINGKGIVNVYQWKNINLCSQTDKRWLSIACEFPKLVDVMEDAFRNIGSIQKSLTMPSSGRSR